MLSGIIHPINIYPRSSMVPFLQRIQRKAADRAVLITCMSACHDIIVPENSSFSNIKYMVLPAN